MNEEGELCARIRRFAEALTEETDQAKASERMLTYLSFAARLHRYSLYN